MNLALSYEGTPAIFSCGGRVLDTGSEIIMLDSTGTRQSTNNSMT